MIIDTAYLASQTCGDEELQSELLTLFVLQVGEFRRDLAEACQPSIIDSNAVLALLHRFKGSARAIGALDLGDCLERAERRVAAGERSQEIRSCLADLHTIAFESGLFASALIDARDEGGLAKRPENG